MGVTTALLIIGGMGLGWLVGDWLKFNPGGIFAGLFLGLVCSVMASIRSVRKFM